MATKTTAATAALIAALLGSIGGYHFLKKHPNPTMREVYAACEKGEVSGIACCEDMLRVTDKDKTFEQCGMIKPAQPDPFGVRAQEEDDWDKIQHEQIKELNK